jgi:hypothetical protein
MEKLTERFPEVASEPKKLPAEEVEAPAGSDESPSIHVIAALLVPTGRAEDARASAQAVESLLGLALQPTDQPLGEFATGAWPSQSEVARGLTVDPGTVSRAVASARKRWLKTPAMTALRDDIAALLDNQGGVMTATELAEALLVSRGSVQSERLRTRQAVAVMRAAVETERDRAAARWILRREEPSGQILLARDELAEDGTPSIDGERRADYKETLGKRADELAHEDPLRPAGRVLETIMRCSA